MKNTLTPSQRKLKKHIHVAPFHNLHSVLPCSSQPKQRPPMKLELHASRPLSMRVKDVLQVSLPPVVAAGPAFQFCELGLGSGSRNGTVWIWILLGLDRSWSTPISWISMETSGIVDQHKVLVWERFEASQQREMRLLLSDWESGLTRNWEQKFIQTWFGSYGTVYNIWCNGNELKHGSHPKSAEQVLQQIKWEVRSRILGKGKFKLTVGNEGLCSSFHGS